MGNNVQTSSGGVMAPDEMRASIQADLNLIENSLTSLDAEIDSVTNIVTFRHDALKSKLMQKFQGAEVFSNDIMRKKIELRKKLNRGKRYSSANYSQPVLFNLNLNFKSLYETFLDHYQFSRNFMLHTKIKYLHLMDQYEEVVAAAIPDNCYNHIIIPMSRHKIFYCVAIFEKKSFLKITNRRGDELYRAYIDPNDYYRQFMIYGGVIAGLFDNLNNESWVIEVYNEQLMPLAKRVFRTKLELWLMSENQIVLKSMNNHEYTFYTFNLELKFTLNLSRIIIESGFKNSVVLTGFNQTEIFLYYTAKKLIKKLDRKMGNVLSSLDLESTEVRSYLNLKMDKESNFNLKVNPSLSIKYFDKDGTYLIQNKSDNLKNFNMLELTKDNDIYFCDNLKRIIYFI